MKNSKKLIPALVIGGIGLATAGALYIAKTCKSKNTHVELIDVLTSEKLRLLEEFVNEEENGLTELGEIVLRKFIAGIKDKDYKATTEDLEKIVTENEFSLFGIFSNENFDRIFWILDLNEEDINYL